MARMTKAQREWRPGTPKKRRSIRTLFASTVLTLEAFAVLFGTLVSVGLHTDRYPAAVILSTGVLLSAALVVTCAFLGRRAGIVAGWVLQVLIIATGFVEPMMFLVGVLFAASWWYAITTGARLDRENRSRNAAEQQWAAEHSEQNPDLPNG